MNETSLLDTAESSGYDPTDKTHKKLFWNDPTVLEVMLVQRFVHFANFWETEKNTEDDNLNNNNDDNNDNSHTDNIVVHVHRHGKLRRQKLSSNNTHSEYVNDSNLNQDIKNYKNEIIKLWGKVDFFATPEQVNTNNNEDKDIGVQFVKQCNTTNCCWLQQDNVTYSGHTGPYDKCTGIGQGFYWF